MATLSGSKPLRLLPTRWIILVVSIIAAAVIGSAIYNFATFLRLRTTYLSNSGQEIAAAIEEQARGPGRRNNPIYWQSLLKSSYAAYSNSVAFLSLVDSNGTLLAYEGLPPLRMARNGIKDVYIVEKALARPRGQTDVGISGWKLRVALRTAETNFLKKQAYLQLAISGMAVLALITLSVGLVRTLNHFLALKVREGAEAQLKSLGIMAASLAHEIRNPLGAMKGLTQLAQEDLQADHAAQPHLKTVVSEAERLERLVSGLLDFARTREPHITEFDLGGLLADLRTMLGSRLESSRVSLQLSKESGLLNVRSDPAGLRQILLNVLINAIDATPESGTVTLSARRDAERKSIIIRVDDTGKGLGQSQPEELFEPFVTQKARGTGLGLAISRQIAESLGASLSLENLPGAGARCTITVPAA